MTASAPVSPQIKPSWGAILAVYLEAPTLRMLALGFSAGLPLLLVLGTLSFRLREAGIDRATIGYLSWIGLAYAFKWTWAPLVDRLPLPLLTRWFGLRRSWLLLAQIAIVAGLVGMAFTDPRFTLGPVIWFALMVAFGSATQDIALDAFRIESAGNERQAALAAAYQTGYRLAMIWAGAGVLWIAAREETPAAALALTAHCKAALLSVGGAAAASTSPHAVAYQNGVWQTAYLVMAASMLIGMIATLASPEPIPRDPVQDRELRRQTAALFASKGLLFAWPLGVAVICVAGLLSSMIQSVIWSLPTIQLLVFAFWAIVGFVGLDRSWGTNRRIHVPVHSTFAPLLAWVHIAVFQPFADFIRQHRRQAVLILALIAVYRISDVVMGIMANPFYVDMCYSKDEVAAVSKIYGVIMTLLGAFVGGALAMRVGVMRVLMLGAVLSAASNLLFAWLGTRGHDVTALILVISADNLSSGIASAAFIAYMSSLTNINYSATQYALFSSLMLLAPKWLAGYSGLYVDHFGYSHFFTATALLGVPVLLLVWLASRVRSDTRH